MAINYNMMHGTAAVRNNEMTVLLESIIKTVLSKQVILDLKVLKLLVIGLP